ncbi:hypothetical protein D9613_001191 [Agrocybe pediades]|uniref:Cytochrome P450 n=1 Tax=Agrocybe pediades TaxID=84607 RepID=A0A8H4R1C4_9AGAR|nr:hypothetical protein D9613_001191 [Agrocybe pediades]
MPLAISYALLIPLLLWGAIIALRRVVKNSHPPYPPGPKPKFLIGNALDIPVEGASEIYMEWGRKYNSGILHVEALGNHIIILNTVEDADELLEKRANNYSDRPVIPIAKMMGWHTQMPLLGYNDEWRFHRKICQQNFRQGAMSQYFPVQKRKVHEMLQGLLKTPEEFDEHNHMLSISLALSSMYGYDPISWKDPCVQAAEKAATLAGSLLAPGGSFVNIFPALGKIPAWVPGAISVRLAGEVRRYTEEMKRIPMEYAKRKFADETAVPSLVADMLERKFTEGISDEEENAIENIAHTVYTAASDTTIGATKTFFYYMAKHPEVQTKAQAEIDRVVGSKRLPDFSDRERMPYLEAMYREVLRIAPPIPMCVPHAVSEDDYYKGYFIPKGAVVLANIWGMTHDENRYPNPYTFNPERFLDATGALNDDHRVLAYGFGRRICVGKYVGSSTLWLMMVSVLACFEIERSKDSHGNYVDMNDEYEDFGIVRHKKKIACTFKVRSEEAKKLISTTYEA